MTVTAKPYPAYKDSGVSWLGEVPAHWTSRPGFSELSEKSVRNVGMVENRVLSLSYGRIVIKPAEKLHGLVPESFETYQIVDPGDIVIRSTDLQNDWTSLRVGIVRDRGIITSAYLCLKTKGELHPEYAFVLLYAFDVMKIFYGLGSGLRQNLSIADFNRLCLFVPPVEEQLSIVRYLNFMDGHIGRYIHCKQKLIKLLGEQKRAIKHGAVTRGVDGDVRLKPSGVEWMGDVPEHWQISRVKAEFQSLNRHRIPLSSTERGEMTLRTYDYYGASGVIDKVDNFLFEGDLLLIAEDGANLVLRNLPLAIVARGRYWVNNHAHILKVRRGNIEYLAAMMETINYQPWISGAAQPKLTQDRLMSIAVAVPPPEEQARIAAFLQVAAQPLDAAIDRARREITLLREYKNRLMADVVTGKLDVRDLAVSIPDEISQEEVILREMESFAENGLEDEDSGLEDFLEVVET